MSFLTERPESVDRPTAEICDDIQRDPVSIRAYLAASTCRYFQSVILYHPRFLDFGSLFDVTARELLADFFSAESDGYVPVFERSQLRA